MNEQTPETISEQERRALAFEHRGQLQDEAGEEVQPRKLPQMVSLRMDALVLATLRDIATERGVSVSDLLRDGAECVISRWAGRQGIAHVSYLTSAMPGRGYTSSFDVQLQFSKVESQA